MEDVRRAKGSGMSTESSRPHMPAEYGIHPGAEGMLSWSWVRKKMAGSRNYWVATAGPNGRPHVAPVWGVWLDDAFFFSTDGSSRKALNLAANPRIAIHLESGDEVAIVEGEAEKVVEPSLLSAIDDAYHRKYRIRLAELGGAIHLAVRPRVVLAWLERDFPKTATRWTIKAA
jgi:hypothetical protein